MTEFTVVVYRNPTEHKIRLQLKWSEHTTKEGPAGITKRQRVRTLLGQAYPRAAKIEFLEPSPRHSDAVSTLRCALRATGLDPRAKMTVFQLSLMSSAASAGWHRAKQNAFKLKLVR